MQFLDFFKFNRLDKYFLKINFFYYIGSFLIFILLFMLGSLRIIIDSILSTASISFLIIIKLLLLTVPQHIMISAPVSLNLSLALTFGNLSINNEILAIKSFGVDLKFFLKPIFFFAIIISLFVFFDMEVLLPYSKKLYIQEINKHRVRSIESYIVEKKVNKYSNYYISVDKIVYQEKNKSKYYKDIKIYEKGNNFNRFIYAKKANILSFEDYNSEQKIVLFLEDGYIVNVIKDSENSIIKVYFKNFALFFPKITYFLGIDLIEKSLFVLWDEIKKIYDENNKIIQNVLKVDPSLNKRIILKNSNSYGLLDSRYLETIFYLKIGLLVSTFVFGISGYSILKGFRNLNLGFSLFVSFVIIMIFYGVFIIFTNVLIYRTRLPVVLIYSLVLLFLVILSMALIIRGRKY